MNRTSEEEFKAVSQESWITPMIRPIATHCMATSLPMPNRPHASGISSKEPPGTPEAPQAEIAARTHSRTAVTGSPAMPMVVAAAIAITVMVTAAPAMLIVAPSGMDSE